MKSSNVKRAADALYSHILRIVKRAAQSDPIVRPHEVAASRTVAKGRLHTGSSRRLTAEERQTAITMLQAGAPVQTIASALAVSRPAIYGLRDREQMTIRRRVSAHV